MRKIIIILTSVIFSIQSLIAQEKGSFGDRFYYHNGLSVFTDFDVTPIRDVKFTKSNYVNGTSQNIDYVGKYSGVTWSVFTYTSNFRLNVYQPNDDFSLSVNSHVAIGFGLYVGYKAVADAVNYSPSVFNNYYNPSTISSMDQIGFLKLSIPVFLQANYGNIATRSSGMETGVTAGVGFEYQLNPIFIFSGGEEISPTFTRSSFLVPCFNVGYCYIGETIFQSNEVLREVNLKIGMGSSETYTGKNGAKISQSPMSVMLTWNTYIDY